MASNQSGSSIGKAVKRGFAVQGRRTPAQSRTPQRTIPSRVEGVPF
jgi:hypothetical protein